MRGYFYQTTRCHVRQESNIHRHRCENLSGDINFSSSHLVVARSVHVSFVVKTGIICQIFLCVLQVCSIHIYSTLTGGIAASLNNTRKERIELTRCLYIYIYIYRERERERESCFTMLKNIPFQAF